MTDHSEEMEVTEMHTLQLPFSKNDEYVICIHMQNKHETPLKPPEIPEQVKQTMAAMQHMGMSPRMDARLSTAEAQVMLSPQEFEAWGSPRPGDKVRVKFLAGERVG